MLINALMLLIN